MKFRPPAIEILDNIVLTRQRDENGNLLPNGPAWLGKSYRKWALSVTGKQQPNLPNERHTRERLHCLIRDGGLSESEIYLAVMAWGGQRRNHGRSSWAGIDRLEPILGALRLGEICRLEGYRQFSIATTGSDKAVRGLGPAFYSKLLFFVPPASPGFIMDQWTAKSMQLLVERGSAAPPIKLSSGIVSTTNNADVYERFCHFIEELAGRYSIDPGNAEELIFSGSRQPWRSHVVSNWTADA
ncbi:hypothetical protein [Kaistia granuli]|uniref:8-oxoguanine DNA glycosylase OGG fold protein n=1 Tax=Kaistia granuli TaxID=363259 RepID=UPI0012ECA47F|nr:hypothetical protein [Kaistia granuli]